MKLRIIALLICLVLLLTACGEKGEFNPDEYIGEGLLTYFGLLIDNNQYFYNEVFALGHLEINEKETVKKDGKTWAKVTDEKINTYEELERRLSSIYTEDCVKEILANYTFYTDIDGALYYDTADLTAKRRGKKWVRDTSEAPEFEGKTENSYTLEYTFKCGKGDEMDEFLIVSTDAGYRLTKLQYVR